MKKFAIVALAIIFSLIISIQQVNADGSMCSLASNVINQYFATDSVYSEHWESLGECRITTYCPFCNSPQGHGSASGVYLEYGHVACGWLPIGTVIRIDGEEFTVVDVCGTDAIDIFMPYEDYCRCDMNTYKNVEILVI